MIASASCRIGQTCRRDVDRVDYFLTSHPGGGLTYIKVALPCTRNDERRNVNGALPAAGRAMLPISNQLSTSATGWSGCLRLIALTQEVANLRRDVATDGAFAATLLREVMHMTRVQGIN